LPGSSQLLKNHLTQAIVVPLLDALIFRDSFMLPINIHFHSDMQAVTYGFMDIGR
jgi:hypothetical protein